MNLLSTLNQKNYTLRRSARLLATQVSQNLIDIGGEPLDGSRGVQTSNLKPKCAANNDASEAVNRPPLELQSEPEIDDLVPLKKKRILGKDVPDHENARPSKRKRGPHLEPVYIIPDVEKKSTTFRGRLG
jgi:hypothetical protein